jgi:hypothetical protein
MAAVFATDEVDPRAFSIAIVCLAALKLDAAAPNPGAIGRRKSTIRPAPPPAILVAVAAVLSFGKLAASI